MPVYPGALISRFHSKWLPGILRVDACFQQLQLGGQSAKAPNLMDHITEFLRAENESLFAYLKANSVYDRETDTYRLHARPDLTGELRDLIAETDIPCDWKSKQVGSTAIP
jgi:hypothetical protein